MITIKKSRGSQASKAAKIKATKAIGLFFVLFANISSVMSLDPTLSDADREKLIACLEQSKAQDLQEYADIKEAVIAGIESLPEPKDKREYIQKIEEAVANTEHARLAHHHTIIAKLDGPSSTDLLASMVPASLQYTTLLSLLDNPDNPSEKIYELINDTRGTIQINKTDDISQRRLLKLKRIRVLIGSLAFLEDRIAQKRGKDEKYQLIEQHFGSLNKLSPMGVFVSTLEKSTGTEFTKDIAVRSARIILTRGLLKLIEQWCTEGMDINMTDEKGQTLLAWAEKFGLNELASGLINLGATASVCQPDPGMEEITSKLEEAHNAECLTYDIIQKLILYGLKAVHGTSESEQNTYWQNVAKSIDEAKSRIQAQHDKRVNTLRTSSPQDALQELILEYASECNDDSNKLIFEIEKSNVPTEHIVDVSNDMISSSGFQMEEANLDDPLLILKKARHLVSFLILTEEYIEASDEDAAGKHVEAYFRHIRTTTNHLGVLAKAIYDGLGLELKDKRTVSAARIVLTEGLTALTDELYATHKTDAPERAQGIRTAMLSWADLWNLSKYAEHVKELA